MTALGLLSQWLGSKSTVRELREIREQNTDMKEELQKQNADTRKQNAEMQKQLQEILNRLPPASNAA